MGWGTRKKTLSPHTDFPSLLSNGENILQQITRWTKETAQKAKTLLLPSDLSSVPETHMVEGKDSCKLSSDLRKPCKPWWVGMWIYMHTGTWAGGMGGEQNRKEGKEGGRMDGQTER